MHIKYISLLILPFIAFWFGYYILAQRYALTTVSVPSYSGHSLIEALTDAHERGLLIHIGKIVYNNAAPDGIIIHQMPRAGNTVKSHQPVTLIISRHDPVMQSPDCTTLSTTDQLRLHAKGITLHKYEVPQLTARPGSCLAQSPTPGTLLTGKKLTWYSASAAPLAYLMPDYRGFTVNEVQDALHPFGHQLTIVHTPAVNSTHQCTEACHIINHYPKPGMVLEKNHSLAITMHVAHKK